MTNIPTVRQGHESESVNEGRCGERRDVEPLGEPLKAVDGVDVETASNRGPREGALFAGALPIRSRTAGAPSSRVR